MDEEIVNDLFIADIQKTLNKYSESFIGKMWLVVDCETAQLNGERRVIINNIEWRTSNG